MSCAIERSVIFIHRSIIDRAVDRHAEGLIMGSTRLHVGDEDGLGMTCDFLCDLERHDHEAVVVTTDDGTRADLRSAEADGGLRLDSLDPARNDGAASALSADRRLLLQD